MISICLPPASTAPSWDQLRENAEELRKRIATADARREEQQQASSLAKTCARVMFPSSLLQLLRLYILIRVPPRRLKLFTYIHICLVIFAFPYIGLLAWFRWLPSWFREHYQRYRASYQRYRDCKRLEATLAALETPEAEEAAERVQREAETEAEAELARQQQLARHLAFIYRQRSAKPRYRLLVRIRLRLSMHPDRCACLLSWLEVCRLSGGREGSSDHLFLPERHHLTFQGAAFAVS